MRKIAFAIIILMKAKCERKCVKGRKNKYFLLRAINNIHYISFCLIRSYVSRSAVFSRFVTNSPLVYLHDLRSIYWSILLTTVLQRSRRHFTHCMYLCNNSSKLFIICLMVTRHCIASMRQKW